MPESAAKELSLVFDATVLSNFAVVGQMILLERLYRDRACTTLAVVEEIRQGLAAGYQHLRSIEEALTPPWATGWLPVLSLHSAEEQALYIELSSFLGAGEASCLTVAMTRGLTLATDDLAARRKATGREVRLTGTLGILVRLVRQGHLQLTEANHILAQMIALRYRAPLQRLDDLI